MPASKCSTVSAGRDWRDQVERMGVLSTHSVTDSACSGVLLAARATGGRVIAGDFAICAEVRVSAHRIDRHHLSLLIGACDHCGAADVEIEWADEGDPCPETGYRDAAGWHCRGGCRRTASPPATFTPAELAAEVTF